VNLSLGVDRGCQDLPSGALDDVAKVDACPGDRTSKPVRFAASGNSSSFERFFADIESTAHHFPHGRPEFLAELARSTKSMTRNSSVRRKVESFGVSGR
jgi:hypothetical protein